MSSPLLELDGALGEGGGQILRTSLAMSLITQTPVHLFNIRAGRKKPGLLNQHLTAVNAAQKIGQAKVEGAKLGSRELYFWPGAVEAGRYHFPIGTAGSSALVFQTVLPPLLATSGRSEVRFEGGTHNDKAPPFDFLERVFVPLLRGMGAKVELKLERHGFYPRGGGAFTAIIEGGQKLSPIHILEKKELGERARALVVGLPAHIGERELVIVKKQTGIFRAEVERIEGGPSPGNALFLESEMEHGRELFTGFGEKGKPAEQVADEAIAEYLAWKKLEVPVGEHLADQLLIPFALAGAGSYRTTPLSLHTTTNIDVLRRFLELEVQTEADASGAVTVYVTRRAPAS